MSIRITNNRGESLVFGGHMWALMLSLAEYYGWKPVGTKKPKGFGLFRSWSGSYATNDGQTVIASDAKQLGEVIAQSLAAPDFDENASLCEAEMKEDVLARVGPELFQTFSLNFDRAEYRKFGEFCREGAFQIE